MVHTRKPRKKKQKKKKQKKKKNGQRYSVRILTANLQIAEFANTVDLEEVADNEPSHPDLHSLPSSL